MDLAQGVAGAGRADGDGPAGPDQDEADGDAQAAPAPPVTGASATDAAPVDAAVRAPFTQVGRVALSVRAGGRPPAQAKVAVPAFDCAAMDGYAIRGTGPWTVIERVLAGRAGQPVT
jgi:hypothetical protein